jgi:hypothetical protein
MVRDDFAKSCGADVGLLADYIVSYMRYHTYMPNLMNKCICTQTVGDLEAWRLRIS